MTLASTTAPFVKLLTQYAAVGVRGEVQPTLHSAAYRPGMAYSTNGDRAGNIDNIHVIIIHVNALTLEIRRSNMTWSLSYVYVDRCT